MTTFEFPPYPKDSGFYKAVRERVKAYFVENKLDDKVSIYASRLYRRF